MEVQYSGSLMEINEIEGSDRIKELEKELNEEKIKNQVLTDKLDKIFLDFNYNVQLIYDRDKEIDSLNEKVDKLMGSIRQKDMEIEHLQGLYKKVKQLENDKLLLTKRLEAFMNSSKFPSMAHNKIVDHKPKVKTFPTPRVYSLSQDSKPAISVQPPDDPDPAPLSRMNSDLERRIKALETENQNKTSRMSTPKSTAAVTERITIKEQEISELIKSLTPYKRELNKSSIQSSLDSALSTLHSSNQRLKLTGRSSSGYKSYIDKKSVVRCISALDKDD